VDGQLPAFFWIPPDRPISGTVDPFGEPAWLVLLLGPRATRHRAVLVFSFYGGQTPQTTLTLGTVSRFCLRRPDTYGFGGTATGRPGTYLLQLPCRTAPRTIDNVLAKRGARSELFPQIGPAAALLPRKRGKTKDSAPRPPRNLAAKEQKKNPCELKSWSYRKCKRISATSTKRVGGLFFFVGWQVFDLNARGRRFTFASLVAQTIIMGRRPWAAARTWREKSFAPPSATFRSTRRVKLAKIYGAPRGKGNLEATSFRLASLGCLNYRESAPPWPRRFHRTRARAPRLEIHGPGCTDSARGLDQPVAPPPRGNLRELQFPANGRPGRALASFRARPETT